MRGDGVLPRLLTGSILGKGKKYSSSLNFPTSCFTDAASRFHGEKNGYSVKLTTRLRLVPWLKMSFPMYRDLPFICLHDVYKNCTFPCFYLLTTKYTNSIHKLHHSVGGLALLLLVLSYNLHFCYLRKIIFFFPLPLAKRFQFEWKKMLCVLHRKANYSPVVSGQLLYFLYAKIAVCWRRQRWSSVRLYS